MKNMQSKIVHDHQDLFDFTEEVRQLSVTLQDKLNKENLVLFKIPPYKRIFLFIFTRVIKSYFAIVTLCKNGYGQDVSTLLRSLLENLITARYIICDHPSANSKAKRFVDYKWIIFKRHLPEEEKVAKNSSLESQRKFENRKEMILEHVGKFKIDYGVRSDRALLTWSGKSVKDMAKSVSKNLLDEYETTFRACSRFSHPTILGDNEYMIQDNNAITFSGLPTSIGIVTQLKSSTKFFIDFLQAFNETFTLNTSEAINAAYGKFESVFGQEKTFHSISSDQPQRQPAILRESRIQFKTQ